MRESRKTSKSFLDRFEGRTNKIGKTGINSVLEPIKTDTSSIIQPEDNYDHHKKVDLDALLPSNPDAKFKPNTSKRSNYMAKPPIKNP